MSKLTFNLRDLAPIIEHARASKEFSPAYGQKPQPGLFLVKDEGIYLMSAGLPGHIRDDGSGLRVVIYADTFNPTDPDCWDRTHDISGDDFSELLPLAWFTVALDAGHALIYIDITEESIGCSSRK